MAVNLARLNVVDITKREDPSGALADIAEVMNEANDVVKDIPMVVSNAPFGHRVTMRSSLPTVSFSKINKASARSKSSTSQVVDTIGMMVARSEVDAKLQDVVLDFNAKRSSEDAAYLEAFTQKVAENIFYGNETIEEDGFTGVAPRMASLQTSVYTTSYVKAHHSAPGTDITSIYVLDWGPRGVHGIYPPARAAAGLKSEDLGKITIDDDAGNPMSGFVTEYSWYMGLTVEDKRHMARLANIDISQALADTSVSLVKSLVQVFNAMAPRGGMRRVAYCRRELLDAIWNQIFDKANLNITTGEYLGETRIMIHGVPLVACDQIDPSTENGNESELS